MNKSIRKLFYLSTFLYPLVAAQASETNITVEYERTGNFGRIYLVDSPFSEDSLRVNNRENTGVDYNTWKTGEKIEIWFDDTVGAILVDKSKNISVTINSLFVDSYFIHKQIASCHDEASGQLPRIAACVNTENKYWDIVIDRNYQILEESLPENAQEDLLVAKQAWFDYTKKQEKAIYSMLDMYDGMSGRIYLLRQALALQTMKIDKAKSLADLIEFVNH